MMIDKEKIGKYDTLFESGVRLVDRIGLCKQESIVTATDDEIYEFGVKHGITFPPAVWSYARYFGLCTPMSSSDYNLANSLRDIDYALHQAGLKNDWLGNKNLKEYIADKNFKVNYDDEIPEDNEGIYTPEINTLMNVNDIIFYSYDPFTRSFKFFDSKQENPVVYEITGYKVVTSIFTSFTNKFRNIIFMFLVNFTPEDFTSSCGSFNSLKNNKVSLSPNNKDYSSEYFECLSLYKKMFKEHKKINRSKLKYYRDVFYQMNNKLEQEEDRILSIIEFENKFIGFLEENSFFED